MKQYQKKLLVKTGLFEIKEYNSDKYVEEIYINGEFILYKTYDNPSINFNDVENNKDEIILVFENNYNKECIYGEFFILEKKVDNK